MATILAHIRVKPGAAARFEALARTLYAGSHAADPGLRRYEYWRGQEPGLYYALLAFDDYRAFMVHQTSAHHEAAAPALQDVIETLTLEWVDPLDGASPLPATVAQPLAADASPLAQSYAAQMPVAVARWWHDETPPDSDHP